MNRTAFAPNSPFSSVPDTHPFTAADAAHLFRRAGFGEPPAMITRAVREGRNAAIRAVLADPSPFASAEQVSRHEQVQALVTPLSRGGDLDALGAWWIRVMVDSPAPLRERLALVWHDHFATSAEKVERADWMIRQRSLFRELGAGDLRTLTRAVVRDPAMLRFLDGDTNEKDAPNENLARELYELFLLGHGHYTEADIREGARALTGLTHRHGKPHFAGRKHDTGEKTVFGKRGTFGADQLVDLCFERPECAEHLASRMLVEFVGPALDRSVVEAGGALLREVEFNVLRFLDRLFRSELFWSDTHRNTKIKGPIEFVVGTVRMLEGLANTRELGRAVRTMGQRLFYPPGVQGWTEGRAWLNSVRWIARERFATALARTANREPGYPLDLEAARKDPDAFAKRLTDRLLGAEVSLAEDVRAALASKELRPIDRVALVLTLPEYQFA
ncbi:MAG: DUF1800 domain-containing protein [Planctomycetota bacterium]